jgi:hypothetical protein
VLEQAVAIGVVDAEGSDRIAEALAMLIKDRFDRGTQAGVRDGGDDFSEVGSHPRRILQGDRSETAHQGGVGALNLVERSERVGLEFRAAVVLTDGAAEADRGADLERVGAGTDRRV